MKSFLFLRQISSMDEFFDISALNMFEAHSAITVVEKIPSITSMILHG